eukprot:2936483-Alexandrium_andersonii.AAC.1
MATVGFPSALNRARPIAKAKQGPTAQRISNVASANSSPRETPVAPLAIRKSGRFSGTGATSTFHLSLRQAHQRTGLPYLA